mgnify:CR=1 FL=1|eukprot:CAMPEP_0202430290 /NCGR_PEP_ID=MMETSP1345-20130828/3770_1 /ASSEMBLY_ACC=CAM_ASM_000843 /TAXON_ID=342563 /ORGANISM="Fabrea Fabrea salina" /LENGTH=205 /DNA_ID=CAMNT_0049041727 /DNA_START=26 /DNA_END=643 /DNA_ORIENTATION=+
MAHDRFPENPVVFTHKDFGAANFDANLPNSYERMWMVCRAINFDLDNYNKLYANPDVALKKRYSKNFLRFAESPLNYLYWHTLRYWQNGTFKLLPFYFSITVLATWWISGSNNYRGSVHTALERTYEGHQQYEFPIETFSFNKKLTLQFHEHEFMMDKGMISQKAAPPYPKFARINNYVRDQNLRKYFAHRERRDVDPFTGKPNN